MTLHALGQSALGISDTVSLAMLLATLAVIDLRSGRLPDSLTIPLIGAGLALNL